MKGPSNRHDHGYGYRKLRAAVLRILWKDVRVRRQIGRGGKGRKGKGREEDRMEEYI